MPVQYPDLSIFTYSLLGALSALLLFVSIIVHELAHSIIAKRNGLKIGRITLYLLGGVSEMTEEPPSSSLELRMSIAGPLASLTIAAVSFAGYFLALTLDASVIVLGPLQYSALFNVIIAGFNLIPAFPMDGGRVLRSFIWMFTGDIIRSTRIASTVGRIFAYAMMSGGVLLSFLFPSFLFEGLWFVVIGWFISSGAQSEYRQILIQRDIANLRARDIMSRDLQKVNIDTSLSEINSLFSLKTKEYVFPVVDAGDQLIGGVAWKDLQNARKKSSDDLGGRRVSEIMIQRDNLTVVKENESAKQVLSLMANNRLGAIFALSDEPAAYLVGVINRTEMVKAVQSLENYRKSAPPEAPAGSERNISVETGMLFQIVVPFEAKTNLSAEFDPSEFSLVSERLLELVPEKQSKEFSFQAIKKGTYYLYLTRPGSKKGSLKYSVIVN